MPVESIRWVSLPAAAKTPTAMILQAGWSLDRPITGASMRSMRLLISRSSRARSGASLSSLIPMRSRTSPLRPPASTAQPRDRRRRSTVPDSMPMTCIQPFRATCGSARTRRRSPPGFSSRSGNRTSWTRCSSGTPTRPWREPSASGPKTSRWSTPATGKAGRLWATSSLFRLPARLLARLTPSWISPARQPSTSS